MEDNSIRAILIGVAVFIAAITISVIVFYFSTAKKVADNVSSRVDIAESFDITTNSNIDEDNLTGVDIRSLIKKYAGSDEVTINILTIKGEIHKIDNVNNLWKIDENTNIISEEKLDIIDPTMKCSVDKEEKDGKIIIKVHLNVQDWW